MMVTREWIQKTLFREVSISPLVSFRILFGSLMLVGIFRFWANGWIEEQFIKPTFHFKYFGFEWVPEPTAVGIYFIFILMALSAVMLAIGLFYRIAALSFFLLFTYVELIDATYYLNHYYFVSLVALLMVFLPAHKQSSVDVAMGTVKPLEKIPTWPILILMFQLGLVYFMAGIAKLNSDWIVRAMPLAIWLPSQAHLPLIGQFFELPFVPHLFSWAGALYDLSIPFLLLFQRTRLFAYVAVIGFHIITGILFQIGMFPVIMIASTLIFFPHTLHDRVQNLIRIPRWNQNSAAPTSSLFRKYWLTNALLCYALFQVLFPFRNLLYPGNPFWHEQSYRFGWRVMLVEKAGYAQFKVHDAHGGSIWVDNRDFLTPVQEKMMSVQTDFMLQYAKLLKTFYVKQGIVNPVVTADVRVSYNGRSSRPFIDSDVNLAAIDDGWKPKKWIKPLE